MVRHSRILHLLLCLLAVMVTVAGCKGPATTVPTPSPIPSRVTTPTPTPTPTPKLTPQETELQQARVPVWSKSDLEVEKLHQGVAYTYQRTIYQRPPFYKGSMPLEFKSLDRSSVFGGMTSLAYDFGEFLSFFVYKDFYLAGARTYDKSGQLLAEIRIQSLDEKVVEAEESHYGANGKLIFKCKSQFDPFAPCFKKTEEKAIGNKAKEYYFVLPDFLGR